MSENPADSGIVEEKEKGITVLANGTLRGKDGKFLPGGHPTTAIRTRERAQEVVKMRQDRASEGAIAGLRAAVAADTGGDLQGIRGTLAHYVRSLGDGILANAVERPYDASRALDKALKWAKLVDMERTPAVTLTQYMVNLSPAVVASWRAEGIIDVEAVDVTGTGGGTDGE